MREEETDTLLEADIDISNRENKGWSNNLHFYDAISNTKTSQISSENMAKIDHELQRYPHSIVWTPIPCLTWLFPFIGHMGIATTEGIIRDFAGPYYVSTDNMAFGAPTKYWTLDPSRANGDRCWWK